MEIMEIMEGLVNVLIQKMKHPRGYIEGTPSHHPSHSTVLRRWWTNGPMENPPWLSLNHHVRIQKKKTVQTDLQRIFKQRLYLGMGTFSPFLGFVRCGSCLVQTVLLRVSGLWNCLIWQYFGVLFEETPRFGLAWRPAIWRFRKRSKPLRADGQPHNETFSFSLASFRFTISILKKTSKQSIPRVSLLASCGKKPVPSRKCFFNPMIECHQMVQLGEVTAPPHAQSQHFVFWSNWYKVVPHS